MKKASDIPRVAILVGTARDWGRNLVRGILAYNDAEAPWHLWVRPNAVQEFDSLPKGWKGEGVIARVSSAKLAKELKESGLPVVNVSDFKLKGFSAPCVRTDDRISARMAVTHFLDKGFKNIAFVGDTVRPAQIWYKEEFIKTLAEQGISCAEFPTTEKNLNNEAEIASWLLSLSKPVGILALGPNLGGTLVDSCRDAGLSVPHDVAVLSSNYDELMCHSCFPPLSGIISPTEQIGFKAAELLDDMMTGVKVQHDSLYLPPSGIKELLSTNTLAVKDPQLVQVIKYIQANAFESITMKDILHAVPMARRTLDRRFLKVFGHSPSEEIRRLRINKARQLLVDTDLPLQLIAEACGYPSYNYLTSVFKQTTGTTPSEYRKQFLH